MFKINITKKDIEFIEPAHSIQNKFKRIGDGANAFWVPAEEYDEYIKMLNTPRSNTGFIYKIYNKCSKLKLLRKK